MTLEEKRSAVKRINDRRKQIEKTFGVDSYPARHYREKMDVLAGGNLLPSGNISHGNAALDRMSDEAIKSMLKQETAGAIIKKGKRHLAKETGADPEELTKEDLASFYEVIRPLQDMLEDITPDMSDALFEWRKANGYLKGSGKGQMTYEQINDALNQWKELPEDERKRRSGAEYREEARRNAENEFSGSPIATVDRTEQRDRTKTSKVGISPAKGSTKTFRTSGVSNKA